MVPVTVGRLRRKLGGPPFLPESVHPPVQHLRSPFEVGQALIERGARVVFGVVQQGEDVMTPLGSR
ncbi:hypothetical protein AB0G12_46395 [Nonomuraea dietziae]